MEFKKDPKEETKKGSYNLTQLALAFVSGSLFSFSLSVFTAPDTFSIGNILSDLDALSMGEARQAEGPGEAEARPAPEASRVSTADITVKQSDTFYGILSAFNVPPSDIAMIAEKAKGIFDLRRLKKDDQLKVTMLDGEFKKIEYRYSDLEGVFIEREDDGYNIDRFDVPHEVRTETGRGVISTSLYEDGLAAGLDPQTIISLSDIFAWDIDFASEIQEGDTFGAHYETVYVDGRPLKTGRILGAEMENKGRKYTAIYYVDSRGKGDYYDMEGRSLSRTLLKSPLRYSRISSHFTMKRYHPILRTYRPHHGIDYAAPTGTPVEASGEGKVVYSGWKGGYGNFVMIRHNDAYTTAYGHLSRIKRGVSVGARVRQGEVVGYVGSTGISTGPHLHYEVHLRGSLINPLSIKPEPSRSLDKAEQARFAVVRDQVMAKLSTGLAVVAMTGERDGKAAAGAIR